MDAAGPPSCEGDATGVSPFAAARSSSNRRSAADTACASLETPTKAGSVEAVLVLLVLVLCGSNDANRSAVLVADGVSPLRGTVMGTEC